MALSMRERLGLQKQVKTNLAALRGGEAGMRERLRLQKAVKADIAKLKGVAGDQRPASPPIDPMEVSPGDRVVWRNEVGEIYGNYRGLTDDGKHAIIVHDGQQSAAPRNEVYPADSRAVTADDMPARAKNSFDKLLLPLLDVAQELRDAREKDAQGDTGGEFAGQLMANPDVQRRIAEADQAIQARIGGIQEPVVVKAAQAYVDEHRPDLTLSEDEQTWRDSGQDEQPDTLTSQAAAGNFNALPLPEFIGKLKEAYSADEDLDGAKTAAVGYLEANREELEEAA